MVQRWLPWTTDARKVVSANDLNLTKGTRPHGPPLYRLEVIHDTAFRCYYPSYGIVAEAETCRPDRPGHLPDRKGYWQVNVWKLDSTIPADLLPLAYAVHHVENPLPDYSYGFASPKGVPWRDETFLADGNYVKAIEPGDEVLTLFIDTLHHTYVRIQENGALP